MRCLETQGGAGPRPQRHPLGLDGLLGSTHPRRRLPRGPGRSTEGMFLRPFPKSRSHSDPRSQPATNPPETRSSPADGTLSLPPLGLRQGDPPRGPSNCCPPVLLQPRSQQEPFSPLPRAPMGPHARPGGSVPTGLEPTSLSMGHPLESLRRSLVPPPVLIITVHSPLFTADLVEKYGQMLALPLKKTCE